MRLKYYSQVTSIHVQHSTVYMYEQRIRVYELTNLMYSIKKYITTLYILQIHWQHACIHIWHIVYVMLLGLSL